MAQKTILIYEIPIYAISKEKFTTKLLSAKNKIVNEFMKHGHTAKSCDDGLYYCFYPRSIWKYNCIVGYLSMEIGRNAISFKISKAIYQNYHCFSRTKHYIQPMHNVGLNIYLGNKSNTEIVESIKSSLHKIAKTELKKYYLDCEQFYNTIDYLNIRGIMNDLKKL